MFSRLHGTNQQSSRIVYTGENGFWIYVSKYQTYSDWRAEFLGYPYAVTYSKPFYYWYSISRYISVDARDTDIDISASDTTPEVNQQVAISATLYHWTVAKYEPLPNIGGVTIWHTLNGVKYYDAKNAVTDNSGKVSIVVPFHSTGTRVYYATFAGGGGHAGITSFPLRIVVS